jgi:predicted permease
MDAMRQDVRYAIRTLVRAPGFVAVTVLTLALGIGLNASVFTLVNGLLMRAPAGIQAPEELVQVARSYDDAPRWDNWSWPAYETIGSASDVFDGVAGYTTRAFLVGRGAEAEILPGLRVTGSFFPVLGVRPAAGRLLGPADDVTPGGHPQVVLGHGYWMRRFGGDPGAVGETLLLSGEDYEVVGVAPRGFNGVEALGVEPAVFVSTAMTPAVGGRLLFDEWGASWMSLVARRAPGVEFERARAAMEGVTAALREADPTNPEIRVLLADGVGMSPEERGEARTLSLLLAGIAVLVLLLTCANVANLFVARATTRVGEMGVRLALGAGRGRLARQLTTESVLLGLLAAVAAVPLLVAGARALPALLPYPVAVSLEPDVRVFTVLAGLGVLAGLLFGGLPSVAAARRDVAGVLREDGATRGGGGRVRDLLVVAQLALSLALVSTAALLGRSVLNAGRAQPGFEPRGLLVATLDPGLTGRYDADGVTTFVRQLRERVEGLPGVRSVSVATQAPFMGRYSRAGVRPLDAPDAEFFEAEWILMDGPHLATLGTPVLEGRDLLPEETGPVVLVNESLAELLWPDGSALGSFLEGGGSPEPMRVVGIVGDVQYRSLRGNALPGFYRPLAGSGEDRLMLHVRTDGDPLSLVAPLRRVVAEVDPGVPVGSVAHVQSRMAGSLGSTRAVGAVAGLFATLAILVAVVGLYALMAFGVSRRVREMGIRKALGARPEALVALVMRRGLGLTAGGVLLGAGLAVAAGRALEHLLYGVDPWSPGLLALSATVLVAAALAASWWPARRASRVEAARSLRDAG